MLLSHCPPVAVAASSLWLPARLPLAAAGGGGAAGGRVFAAAAAAGAGDAGAAGPDASHFCWAVSFASGPSTTAGRAAGGGSAGGGAADLEAESVRSAAVGVVPGGAGAGVVPGDAAGGACGAEWGARGQSRSSAG